jgi:O-antigen ligase
VELSSWHLADLAVAAFLGWLAVRTFTQPLGSIAPHQPHTLMHAINGYCIPLALYAVLRFSKPSAIALRPAFWVIAILGFYLSVTAWFEAAKLWGLVFPKFIADPSLGIHFGRARGPMLQSVRLGVCLLACWSCIVVTCVWLSPFSKSRWLFVAASIPVYWGAVFFTYTRSIWMGLVLIVAMFVVFCLQGAARRALVVGGGLASLLLAVVIGPHLVAFKREYSAEETRESTYMRAAFAYVSLQMFKERPIAGFGFNQFNAANRQFLSDRSTNIRLESIRGYVHHNSFLSLLVDLGIVGLALYLMMLTAFVRQSWELYRRVSAPPWVRRLGLLSLCITGVHLIQMAFHEVSFSSIENSLLLGCFGLVVSARNCLEAAQESRHYQPALDGSCNPLVALVPLNPGTLAFRISSELRLAPLFQVIASLKNRLIQVGIRRR